MASDSEQRDADRIPILRDLQGEIMVFEPLQIKDHSWGGASIQTAYPLAIDTLHDLRLTLRAQSIVLKARVTHSRIINVDQDITTYRSGIEFVEPPDRVRAVIAQFLVGLLDSSKPPAPEVLVRRDDKSALFSVSRVQANRGAD